MDMLNAHNTQDNDDVSLFQNIVDFCYCNHRAHVTGVTTKYIDVVNLPFLAYSYHG